ncbi:hypothetical protein C2W62_35510 [Candidatus Entotheonella serta]|nr:hypothetical protein C2W62_35510 [Candidatus Entotheonella serta]
MGNRCIIGIASEKCQHVAHIDQFFDTLQSKPGSKPLPAFSYLEPLWVGLFEVSGFAKDTYLPNSYHPPAEVAPGEAFLKKLYEALRQNEAYWEKTLLIITFDEHGGTYDHVPPPAPAASSEFTAPPPLPGGEFEFQFNRFGVRVPAIMISPWIQPHTVFHSLTDYSHSDYRTPYDHASVIKTVLNWDRFGISIDEQKFGQRVASAPTFESVLFESVLNVPGDKPRMDAPKTLPNPYFKVNTERADFFSALQAYVLPLIVALINDVMSLEQAFAKAEQLLENVNSIADLHQAISKLVQEEHA